MSAFFHHQIRIPIANSKASSFSAPRYLELTALTTALIDVVEQSYYDPAIL
ncbi:MAG: hypothetical protein ACPGK1_00095 [bacterium]